MRTATLAARLGSESERKTPASERGGHYRPSPAHPPGTPRPVQEKDGQADHGNPEQPAARQHQPFHSTASRGPSLYLARTVSNYVNMSIGTWRKPGRGEVLLMYPGLLMEQICVIAANRVPMSIQPCEIARRPIPHCCQGRPGCRSYRPRAHVTASAMSASVMPRPAIFFQISSIFILGTGVNTMRPFSLVTSNTQPLGNRKPFIPEGLSGSRTSS